MSFSSNFGRAIDLANASIKSKTKFAGLETDIGSLSDLVTTNKSSLVAAINELKSKVAELEPVITLGQTISGNASSSFSYTVTGTNLTVGGNIKRISWSASGLPPGLSINPNTGEISGTPTTAGNYNITVTATTNIGTATGNIAMEVTMPAYLPEITSGQSISGKMTQAITSYQVTGTNVATDSSKGITTVQWTASGLPSGLSINSSTGVISGTVSSGGSWTATVTCTTNYGSASAAVSVSIANYYPPSLGNLSNTTAQMGTPMVCASNDTNAHVDSSKGITSEQWSASGLPPGVSVNSIGQIVGTPTTAGTYNGTYTVTTNYGTATASVYIVVAKYYPPDISDSEFYLTNQERTTQAWVRSLTMFKGIPMVDNSTFKGTWLYFGGKNTDVDSNKGITNVQWSVSGLPSGVSKEDYSARSLGLVGIYGTPKVTGSFTATITCTNNYGSSTRTLPITVKTASYPPKARSSSMTFTKGKYSSYYIGDDNYNTRYNSTKDVHIWNVYVTSGSLPSGLYLYCSGTSAYLRGTPTVTGTYTVGIMVCTNQGSAVQTSTLKISS